MPKKYPIWILTLEKSDYYMDEIGNKILGVIVGAIVIFILQSVGVHKLVASILGGSSSILFEEGVKNKGNEAEIAFWKSTEKCDSNSCYKIYLTKYPNGMFSQLARENLVKITDQLDKSFQLSSPIIKNARIYLLYESEKHRKNLEIFKEELINKNYRIIGFKKLIDIGRPDFPEIRYFNFVDKVQANILASYVSYKLNETVRASYYEDKSAKVGYIEIWLGR